MSSSKARAKPARQRCGVCGRYFKVETRVGRPTLFCGTKCKDVSHAMSVLLSRVDHVATVATDAAWKSFRGSIWRMTNGRGVNDLTGVKETQRLAVAVAEALGSLGIASRVEKLRVFAADGTVLYTAVKDAWMTPGGDLVPGGLDAEDTARMIAEAWSSKRMNDACSHASGHAL